MIPICTPIIESTLLDRTKQAELFSNCSYDPISGKVRLPNGTLVNRTRFNVWFGGYTFQMADGRFTRSARQAFTQR
jgi:hypothetical protein